jgi:hypothetical protein
VFGSVPFLGKLGRALVWLTSVFETGELAICSFVLFCCCAGKPELLVCGIAIGEKATDNTLLIACLWKALKVTLNYTNNDAQRNISR